jgi:hypothetical protein
MFLKRMFVTFFGCTMPASSIANPPCMKKMRVLHTQDYPADVEVSGVLGD